MIIKKEELNKIADVISKVPSKIFEKIQIKLIDGKIMIENVSNKLSYVASFEVNSPGINTGGETYILKFSTKKSMEKILILFDELKVEKDDEFIELLKYNSSGEVSTSLTLPLMMDSDEDNIPHDADVIFDMIINNNKEGVGDSKIEFTITPDELSDLLDQFGVLNGCTYFEMLFDPKKGLLCTAKDDIDTKVVHKFDTSVVKAKKPFKSLYEEYFVSLLSNIKPDKKKVDKVRVIVGEPLTIFEYKENDDTYIFSVITVE
jgi:hypothetical protein